MSKLASLSPQNSRTPQNSSSYASASCSYSITEVNSSAPGSPTLATASTSTTPLKRKRGETSFHTSLSPAPSQVMRRTQLSLDDVPSLRRSTYRPPRPEPFKPIYVDTFVDELPQKSKDTTDAPESETDRVSPTPTEIISDYEDDTNEDTGEDAVQRMIDKMKAKGVKVRDFVNDPSTIALRPKEVWPNPLITLTTHDRWVHSGEKGRRLLNLTGKQLYRLLENGLVTKEEVERYWSEEQKTAEEAYRTRAGGPYPYYTREPIQRPTRAYREVMREVDYRLFGDEMDAKLIWMPPDEPTMVDVPPELLLRLKEHREKQRAPAEEEQTGEEEQTTEDLDTPQDKGKARDGAAAPLKTSVDKVTNPAASNAVKGSLSLEKVHGDEAATQSDTATDTDTDTDADTETCTNIEGATDVNDQDDDDLHRLAKRRRLSISDPSPPVRRSASPPACGPPSTASGSRAPPGSPPRAGSGSSSHASPTPSEAPRPAARSLAKLGRSQTMVWR